ncbi:MAG: hypothetical protein HQL46_00725 [Gammaproteobacteria bacterium]|nr:hypothetical protein [Gammaproteobacteria bacterium]
MTICCAFTLVACNSTTQSFSKDSNIVLSQKSKIITANIDSKDYNKIAKFLHQSLQDSSRIKQKSTVALGPVSLKFDNDGKIDIVRMQEKIQVLAHKSDTFNFSFAVDAISGESAAMERYKIMELQWEQQNTIDPLSLKTFGDLVPVDYLLFGRVSSTTAKSVQGEETTYVYNWKLGDCKTGLLVWTDEMELVKRIYKK